MHEYFKDGINRALALKPDANTKRILGNGKMLFKSLGNNAVVLFKADSDRTSPFIDLGPDIVFRFYLTTEGSDAFFNITKLDTANNYVVGNKLYFTNNPAQASADPESPEVLTHTLLDRAFTKLFTYSFSLGTTHTKTKFKMADSEGNLVSVGKDAAGNDLPTILNLTRDDSKQFHQQVDVRNKVSGVYTITITNDSGATILREETVLIDDQSTGQGILGIVDIKYNTATGHMYGATEYYRLRFERKTAFWKYLVVNKTKSLNLSDPTTNLSIEDSPSGGGPPYANVDFNLEGTEPHTSIKVKGYDTVVFKSSDKIPSFEEPKLNVKLVLKPSDQVMVEHLSNPPANTVEKENGGDIEKEIFVFI